MGKVINRGILFGFIAFSLLGCETIDSTDAVDREEEELDARVASTGHTTNNLLAGGKLTTDQYLSSSDGSHRLYFQGDGNLVLRRTSDQSARWASGTNGKAGKTLSLQGDGNLVMYTASGVPVWSTGTVGSGATTLYLHSAGQLVLYRDSTVVWSANGAPEIKDNCPNDPNKTEPGLCGCGKPEGTCSGGGPNPYCQSGSSGEDSGKNETGSLSYNGQSVAYELRGGVIKTKNSPNACVETTISSGQTQIVTLGTSDGGCTSCKVGEPVDSALMQNQGFTLVKAIGDQDARTEVWTRVFDAQKSNHYKFIAISGKSNAVAWVIAKVATRLDASKLASGVSSSGSGRSLEKAQGNYGWLHMKSGTSYNSTDFQRKSFQFKFVAGFLDDTCSVDEEGEDNQMMSFWGQGDGDTFFVGIWGSGENVKDKIFLEKKEDWGFDVAIVAMGQNP